MRKKSKYKPRHVRPDTISYVLSGMKAIADVPTAGTLLSLKNHSALDEILHGRGTQEHVEIIIGVVNMAEVLASYGIGQDWIPEIEASQQAIKEMAQRGLDGKPFLFTGPEMQLVKTIFELHDEQLKICTVKQMEDATQYIETCIRNKKAITIARKVAA